VEVGVSETQKGAPPASIMATAESKACFAIERRNRLPHPSAVLIGKQIVFCAAGSGELVKAPWKKDLPGCQYHTPLQTCSDSRFAAEMFSLELHSGGKW
jgi:hypothetical protein